MERVQTRKPDLNVHVLDDIQDQIVMWLIIAITDIAHITVLAITTILITNVDVIVVI